MKVIGCIPARYASSRFPGKPLALIKGKPMIQWVCEGVSESRRLTSLMVATDDERIAEVVRKAGFSVQMTDPSCATGTDRIFQAVQRSGIKADVVVNIQGDEPLVNGPLIDSLVEPLLDEEHLEMSTLAHEMLWQDLDSPNVVKVIVNLAGEAIYFSRFPIPYSGTRDPHKDQTRNLSQKPACLRHIGLYAYRMDFLGRYCKQQPLGIETAEALEQLRALGMGARIKVVKVLQQSWGVDTPEDLAKVEALIE